MKEKDAQTHSVSLRLGRSVLEHFSVTELVNLLHWTARAKRAQGGDGELECVLNILTMNIARELRDRRQKLQGMLVYPRNRNRLASPGLLKS